MAPGNDLAAALGKDDSEDGRAERCKYPGHWGPWEEAAFWYFHP